MKVEDKPDNDRIQEHSSEENAEVKVTPGAEEDASAASSVTDNREKKPARQRRHMSRWISVPLKTLMWLVIIVLLIPVALYIPPVQTFVKDVACRVIKSSTGMDVSIDRFRLKFPLDVSLQGVRVIEAAGDTMVLAKEVVADVALLPLLKLDVDVKALSLHDGYYRMVSPDSSMIMKIKA